MVEHKVTKWMKPPLADHIWTPEEIEKYYEKREKDIEEYRTIGKANRQKHNVGVSIPSFEYGYAGGD